MTLAHLVAFCMAFWTLIHPGLPRQRDAAAIATAAAQAVLAEAAGPPALTSHNEDLAALAFQAFRESSLDAGAKGDCTDPADPSTCKAHGPWQLHGECGQQPLEQQARCALALLHSGAAMCPGNALAVMWGACHGKDVLTGRDVGALAAARLERERKFLGRTLGPGLAEMQK